MCSSFKSGFPFVYSIALGCIYTESKGYPREPAAHVAIRKCPIEMVFLGHGIYINIWSVLTNLFLSMILKLLATWKAGTVRRFLEKHKDKINAVVFCSSSATDTEIYKRLV